MAKVKSPLLTKFRITLSVSVSVTGDQHVILTPPSPMPRWTVIFHPAEKDEEETKKKHKLDQDTEANNTNEDTTKILVMNNYFGIGIDAEISHDFHEQREADPEKFKSR